MNPRQSFVLRLLGIVAAFLLGIPAFAGGYILDSQGNPLRASDGRCVRSGSWSITNPMPGCDAMPDRIILLPDPEGRAGAVIVRSAKGEQSLTKAYAGLEVTDTGDMRTKAESEESVRARYGALLDAQPPRPETFVVHFQSGSATELTPDSAAVVAVIRQRLASWPAPQIAVVGHTDQVGSTESNDQLSLKRAQTVVEFLVQQGIPASRIEAAGRGEREPLVQTVRGVAEAANRRVEITLR